jgi:hypothetical protein
VEIDSTTLRGRRDITACQRSGSGETYDCSIHSPLGAAPTCMVAVGLADAGARPADGIGGAVITDWVVLPCSAFFDSDSDGTCDSVRDTGTAPPGADPSALLAQASASLHGVGGLAPPCSRLQPENDPFMVLDIVASDPQSDLTSLSVLPNPIFGAMRFDFSPTASLARRAEIHHTCSLRADEITVGASDRYGFTTTTTCTWREGVTCIP